MSFPGSVLLGPRQWLEVTTNQRLPLGTRGYTKDGRVFRYAFCGTALTVGHVVQAPAPASTDIVLNALLDAAVTTAATKIVLELSSTAIGCNTDQYYREGYFHVNDGTGEGQYRQIVSQPLSTNSTVTIYIAQGDELHTALTTGACEVGLVCNPYKYVIPAPPAQTAPTIGVAPRTVAADRYFWVQTWGPCSVLTDGALVVAENVIVTQTDTGAVVSQTTSQAAMINVPIIGQAFHTGEDLGFPMIYLQLAP